MGRADHVKAGWTRREAGRDAREKHYDRSIAKVTCQDDAIEMTIYRVAPLA
jgi:hypothetical protein